MAANDWGYGAAKLVRPATKEATELVVYLSDLHIPYQEQDVLESALALVGAVQPHRIVLNGDVCDFFQLSRFNKGHDREDTLQEEIDESNLFRETVREIAPNAVIDENEGNHDNRLLSYLEANAQSLKSLRALRPESLFGYKKLDINWHPGCGFRLRKRFLVKHGDLVRQDALATAKAELKKAGISGVSGHTHRLGSFRAVAYEHTQWMEQGCMCRLDPDYIVGPPNWTQGIAVGEHSTKTENFVLHEVPFVDGQLHLGLETY